MTSCRENLYHAQELQKRAHDKGAKPRSYASGDKVWLKSKNIKTKRNRKVGSRVLLAVSSSTPGWKASLQARAAEEMEDSRRSPRATAGAGHHPEGASGREREAAGI